MALKHLGNGWDADEFGRDAAVYELPVPHRPGCIAAGMSRIDSTAAGPVTYRRVGRSNRRQVLECVECGARLPLLDKCPATDGGAVPATAPSRPRRGPGRPGWTSAVYAEHLREAIQAVAEHAAGEHKDDHAHDLAGHFRQLDGAMGVDPAYLRKLDGKHGRNPG